MSKKDQRIEKLEQLILQYQKSYYDGEAEISDAEFDLLWDELQSLAPESSVLKKIGAGSDALPDVDGFPKAKHLIPMGSQEKAANPGEFNEWVNKRGIERFLVQYKLDGASLELQYEKGILVQAITRGDGITGDDITVNARRMRGVLPKISAKFSGGIRGEVVMTHEVWQDKYADKANCRNAANGIMRRKDGEGCENLLLITYDAAATGDDGYFGDEVKKIEWLGKQGFVTTESQIFDSADDIIAYRSTVASLRDTLPFDIDGLVVKNINIDMTDLRRARPEKQIAFKFDLEIAFSILREVIWSESGATYTPIGVVDPVRIAGTTVQRATLNNPDMIRSLGLSIGCAVCVVKRGEIIPKIEGLAPDGALGEIGETSSIEFPSRCAVCGAELVDAGSRLYCPNAACPKRLLHRLEKWISVLDIREIGEKLITQLFDKKRVRHIDELYTLEVEELAGYQRMADVLATKVLRHINTKRELSLATFVAGFDFEGVAETTMEKVAAAGFDTLEKVRAASVEEIATVHGVGTITAQVIVDGLKETTAEMDAVLAKGVISIAPPPSAESQPMRGMSFCFTGELSMKRIEAEEKVKALGAQAKSQVVKGLSYLVTNDPSSGSAKNKKAHELGIPIIDEAQFIALLKTGSGANGVPSDGDGQGLLF